MNPIKKTTIKQSLAHWDKMIKWSKLAKNNSKVSKENMRNEILETWSGVYCPICNTGIDCDKCFMILCCSTIYKDLDKCKTWKEWSEIAEKIRKYIADNNQVL